LDPGRPFVRRASWVEAPAPVDDAASGFGLPRAPLQVLAYRHQQPHQVQQHQHQHQHQHQQHSDATGQAPRSPLRSPTAANAGSAWRPASASALGGVRRPAQGPAPNSRQAGSPIEQHHAAVPEAAAQEVTEVEGPFDFHLTSRGAADEVSWWLRAAEEETRREREQPRHTGVRHRRRRHSAGMQAAPLAGTDAQPMPSSHAHAELLSAAGWEGKVRLRQPGESHVERRHGKEALQGEVPVERVSGYALVLGLLGAADRCLPIFKPSRARISWDFLMLTLLIYTAIMVPLQAGFREMDRYSLDVADICILIVFWLDMFVQFRTAYISDTGELVRISGQIAAHYTRTWFPLDLASSLPWDALIQAALRGQGGRASALLTMIRMTRLLKLLSATTYQGKEKWPHRAAGGARGGTASAAARARARPSGLLRMLDRHRYSNVLRLVGLFLLTLLVAHWTGCTWHGLSEWLDGWPWIFDRLYLTGETSLFAQYAASLYYALVLVVGGDNLPAFNNVERVFYVLALIMGAVLYALIVSRPPDAAGRACMPTSLGTDLGHS
ncbi:Potassium voltage-gated channel subfamily H member 7, partial [Tetrabaena socialis]